MQTTIEIDSRLIRDDYEIIAFRQVLPGELIMNRWGYVSPYGGENKSDDYCLIVRPAWQWPDWIKPGWVFQNSSLAWLWANREPRLEADDWHVPSPHKRVFLGHLNFTPPPCTDWRESKRQKPLTGDSK